MTLEVLISKVTCALKNMTMGIDRRFYNRIYFYNLFYILVYDTLTKFLIYGIKYSDDTLCVVTHATLAVICMFAWGFHILTLRTYL